MHTLANDVCLHSYKWNQLRDLLRVLMKVCTKLLFKKLLLFSDAQLKCNEHCQRYNEDQKVVAYECNSWNEEDNE